MQLTFFQKFLVIKIITYWSKHQEDPKSIKLTTHWIYKSTNDRSTKIKWQVYSQDKIVILDHNPRSFGSLNPSIYIYPPKPYRSAAKASEITKLPTQECKTTNFGLHVGGRTIQNQEHQNQSLFWSKIR